MSHFDSPRSSEILKCHWRTCGHCSLIFPLKTHHLHENSCQGLISAEGNVLLSKSGCIANGVLYATVTAINEGDVFQQFWTKKKPVVLMHPSTMMLFKFCNAGPVLVHGSDKEIVCHSWACSAVDVGSIAFPDSVSFSWNPGDKFTLHHYKKVFSFAAKVYLTSENFEKYMLSKKFKAALLCELGHMFTRVGAAVSLNYLGANCGFIVEKIINPFSKDLSSNMTLEDKTSEETIDCLMHLEAGDKCKINNYFVITSQTKVIIKKRPEREMKRIVFDCIGGLTKQLKTIRVIMNDLLSRHYVESYERLYTGVLLSGPPGTGKTLVAKALANEYNDKGVTFITIEQSEINDSQCENNIAKVKEKFKEAIESSPSVLFIDDIDKIFPKEGDRSVSSYQNKRLTTEVADMIDGLMENPHCAVMILAATSNAEVINPIILKQGRIDRTVRFDIPNTNARCEIVKKLLGDGKHDLTKEEMEFIAATTEQYTGADLSYVCAKAAEHAGSRCLDNSRESCHIEDIFITSSDFTAALKEVKPSSSDQLIANIPKVQWDDIRGMFKIKKEVKEHFDLIFSHSSAWESIGITPARGFLMYGPPGCAKTMIAMAVANEIKANFIAIKGPELLKKYVGQSEKAVHELFLHARRCAPCIIYFDEIDSIAIERKSHDTSSKVDERVLSQLLVEMDGIDALKGVIVVASTNRPHMIDSALLRPGRFDQKIYVPLPDSQTRKDILLVKLKGIPENEVDLQNLVEQTDGYSCAEVVALCDKAIQEFIVGEISLNKHLAFMPLFHNLLDCSSPKTSMMLLDIYKKFSTDCCFNK